VLRSPEGEQLVLEQKAFIERNPPVTVLRKLSTCQKTRPI
jgi:hypothetical protein